MAEKYLKIIFKESERQNIDLNVAKIRVYEELRHRTDFDAQEFERAEKAIKDRYKALCTAWANDKFETLDIYELYSEEKNA